MDLQLASDDGRFFIRVDVIVRVNLAGLVGNAFLDERMIDLLVGDLLSARRIFGPANRFLSDIDIWFGWVLGLDVFWIRDYFWLDNLIILPLCLELLDGSLQGLAILLELVAKMRFHIFHTNFIPVLVNHRKVLPISVVHAHQLDHALDDRPSDGQLGGVDLVIDQVLDEFHLDRLELLLVEVFVQSVSDRIVIVGHSIETFDY